MHIAVVTRNMQAGGAERVIVQLLKHWISQGNTCDLILIETAEKRYNIPEGVKTHEINIKKRNRVIDKFFRYFEVRKLITQIKPEIVLSMPEEIGIYVLLFLMGKNVPIVVSERNDPWVMPNKKITRLLRKITYPFANGIVFQTEQAASFFSEKIRNKGIVLSNPLDISRIPQPYKGVRSNIIVGAGRLVPQKNFHLLIDAFSDFYIEHPNYKLVIYGDGYLKNELEEYSRKLPQGAVVFPGVSDCLLENIKDAAMFVLTSDYEGVPNVLIEAMAMGMPVIATDCHPGGASALINNGENGIIVPVGDRQGVKDAMEKIVNEPETARNIGNAAVLLKGKLDSEVVSDAWLQYFKKCC